MLMYVLFVTLLTLQDVLGLSPQDCHCNPILTCESTGTSEIDKTHVQEICKNASLSVLRQQEENFFKVLHRSLDYPIIPKQCECDCDFIRKSNRPRDCEEILEANSSATSGIYRIYPLRSDDGFLTQCDMDSELYAGGWTVFQRMIDGSVNFNRGWADYQSGFGNLSSSFWLGLENINKLVSQGNYALMINMATGADKKYAVYRKFFVGPVSTEYMLFVGNYTGDAGDALSVSQNEMKFSTKDRDNDKYSRNIAMNQESGWWYNNRYGINVYVDLNKKSGFAYWGLNKKITFAEMEVKRLPYSQFYRH